MPRQSRTVSPRLFAAVCFVALALQPVRAGTLTDALPHVKGTRAIVLEQLEVLLAADKDLQLVGQGSWLKTTAELASKNGAPSRAYVDPLLVEKGASDHDLRLVLKGREEAALGSKFATLSQAEQLAIRARDDAAVAAKWLTVRENLIKNLRSAIPMTADANVLEQKLLQYGFNASEAASIAKTGSKNVIETVLGSVNLYAPPSLIRTVVDDRTARTVYHQIGAVPNLGGKEVEGVWGIGASAATQEFEAGGKLFYNGIGGARTGFVDLVHLSEEYGRYSFGGAANMSVQWAEKAAEAIRTGDLTLVGKYLKRLKATWALAIKKGGLRAESMSTSISELNAFIAAADKGEMAVLSGGRTLEHFLRTARMQSTVLGQLARDSASVDREIMLAILEAQPLSRWEKVGNWFRDVWPSAESFLMFERALQGTFLVFSTWQVSGTWGDKGMEDALRQAGVEGALLVSLPVGALTALTNSFIDNAKEFGYNSAVQPQEWREFLAGISSVTGYEGFTKTEISIETLAVQCVSADEVRHIVETQAFNISQLKDTGAAETDPTRSAREAIKDKLVAKMTPIVLAEWLRERKRRLTAYLDLALELDARMRDLVISVKTTPEPVIASGTAPSTATVQLMTSEDLSTIQELLGRMEAAIRPLGGRQHIVPFSYRATISYTQDDKSKDVTTTGNLKDLLTSQSFQVSGRGGHPFVARFAMTVRAPSLGTMDEARDVYDAQPLLGRTYERTIPFIIDVVSPLKGHWKFVGVDAQDLSAGGKQEAQVCRGCAPAWTVGDVLLTPSSLISRLSGTKDFANGIKVSDLVRKPYTIEQVLSWTGLPDVIVPGTTYTSTATLSWKTSDESVMPAASAARSNRVYVSLPDGQQYLEPTTSKPVASAQWKAPDLPVQHRDSAPLASFWVQVEFGGPGGSAHLTLRWDWVENP